MSRNHRRGRGEGSVFQRKDGLWVASLQLGWESGRRKRKDYYASTKQEAQRKLAKARRLVDDGIPLPDERQRLDHFLDRWLTDVAQQTVRASTFIRYGELARHVTRAMGARPLRAVTPQALSTLYAQKVSDGLAPRTVGHIHRFLHRSLSDAVRWGLITRNPCDLVTPPRVPVVEMKSLSAQQSRDLVAAAQGDPLEALYVLAVTAGLRLGELQGLRWSDIDLAAGTVKIQRTARRIKGEWVEGEPKSRGSRRVVDLAPLAAEALQRHREAQQLLALRRLVFTGSGGSYLDASWLRRRSFRPLLERAGLPLIRLHDLRHTAASLMLEEGTHPKVVQEMLGHSNFGITMDTYSHVAPRLHREAAQRMDALLRG